jgi:branched-subunit amino acid aminotransferase/4-amino-4-deoxychorismate lyase
MSRFWIEQREVGASEFVVSATDSSFTMGLTVFETMRSYCGKIFRLNAHVDRLRASLRRMSIHRDDLEDWVPLLHEVTAASVEPLCLRWTFGVDGTAYLQASAIDSGRVGRPLSVVTRSWEPPDWLNGTTKHGSRAFGEVLIRQLAVDEVLWIGQDRCFTEGSRSNVFAVLGDRLMTPLDDGRILSGVTRGAVIESANDAGIEVVQGGMDSSTHYDALFMTSTLKELAHIETLDGVQMPSPGALFIRLSGAFRDLVARECG